MCYNLISDYLAFNFFVNKLYKLSVKTYFSILLTIRSFQKYMFIELKTYYKLMQLDFVLFANKIPFINDQLLNIGIQKYCTTVDSRSSSAWCQNRAGAGNVCL